MTSRLAVTNVIRPDIHTRFLQVVERATLKAEEERERVCAIGQHSDRPLPTRGSQELRAIRAMALGRARAKYRRMRQLGQVSAQAARKGTR